MNQKTEKKPISELSNIQLEYIHKANKIIAKMLSYGVKTYNLSEDGFKLNWSNGSQDWWISDKIAKNTDTRLDANQFIIYGIKEVSFLKEILPYFDQLPLYSFSTEARMRGQSPDNVNTIVKELRKRAQEIDPRWGELKIIEF